MSLRAADAGRALLVPWVVCAPLCAGTLRVPQDHATIQDALDAAEEGDTVLVAPGEYEVEQALDGNRRQDPLAPGKPPPKNFTLLSEAGPEATTIRCAVSPDLEPSSVVVFRHGEGPSTLIEGFTITGGSGTETPSEDSGGGGILCLGSSPTIRNCKITGNNASAGGGVLAAEGAGPTLVDCIIEENEASLGGGIDVHGPAAGLVSVVVLRSSTLRGNLALIGGGAFCRDGGILDAEGCAFAGNGGEVLGGGLACDDGGVSVSRSSFLGNWAEDGGGVYLGAGEGRFVNCLIAGNVAHNGGGAMLQLTPGDEFVDPSALFLNCTIADNTAYETPSGGMYFVEPEGDLVNSIVWGNLEGSLHPLTGAGRFRHSIVQGPSAPAGEGNSNDDPLFLARGKWDPFNDFWEVGDYHVVSGSPAIDAGTADGAPAIDLEGRFRPCGTGVDIGAHESGGCAGGGPRFRRGDSNADGSISITDPVFTLDGLFRGRPQPACEDAADADDSGAVNLTDAVFTLEFLFRSGPRPPEPEACGEDPTADDLACPAHQSDC